MKKRSARFLALTVSFVLICGLSAGTGKTAGNLPGVRALAADAGETAAAPLLSLASYDDVYAAVASQAGYYGGGMMGGAYAASAPASADSGKAAETAGSAASSASADYTGTNVQVDGIDEADIVKTDGSYIYLLRNGGELTVLKAGGGKTGVVSETAVSKGSEYGDNYSYSDYVSDMYLCGDRLVILKTVCEWKAADTVAKAGDIVIGSSGEKVYADIYDVSDPSAPKLSAAFGQDGTLSSSRLTDGMLYLISTSYVYQPVADDPGTFVPCTYAKGTASLMPLSRILIPADAASSSWTVVSSIDVGAGKTVSALSFLGNSSTVYMSKDSLCIGCGVWKTEEGDPYTKDQYTVRDCRSYTATDVFRFTAADGALSFAASARVPGYLVNQFAMDEYNGNLRLVTTTSENRYHTYTDEKYGWTNYLYDDCPDTSGLYIFDGGMQLLGSVTGLGEDERVYSVRFSGDTGYFVTFRQIDPLFAVDLSDPKNPKVLSALKIPGFSEYLHPYGDGLLLGIGMSADAETGRTQALKLSMFDVSDPADVSEKSSLGLDASWSPALYNHHAVLADAGKNIIGFAADSSYVLYKYSNGAFRLLASVDIGGWSGDARGVLIGGNIYVCTPVKVSILSLDGNTLLKNITLPVISGMAVGAGAITVK